MFKIIKQNRWNKISEDKKHVIKYYTKKSKIFAYNKFDDETIIKNQVALSKMNSEVVFNIIEYGKDYHISIRESVFNHFNEINKEILFETIDKFAKLKPNFELNSIMDYQILKYMELPKWSKNMDLNLDDKLFDELAKDHVLNMGDVHMWNIIFSENVYKFIDLDSIVYAPYWYDYAHMFVSTREMQNREDIILASNHMKIKPEKLIWMCEQVGKLQLLEWIWRDNREEYLLERDATYGIRKFLREMKTWKF
ncbi:MAG: phosphotransferase [Mycoplasmatales bacterium]|nr:phosphotransferase [Mycoplasmatales bacterium]